MTKMSNTARRKLNAAVAKQLAQAVVRLDGKNVFILSVDTRKVEYAVWAKVGRVEQYVDASAFQHLLHA